MPNQNVSTGTRNHLYPAGPDLRDNAILLLFAKMDVTEEIYDIRRVQQERVSEMST